MADDDITAATRVVESLAPGGFPFSIRVPLVEDECRWFVRAVDREVIRFRECDPTCFRFKKWNKTGPDHFDTPSGKPRHLFSKPIGPEAWLNREYVPHIAAYAKAVIDHGYAIEQSSFSRYRKFTRDLISSERVRVTRPTPSSTTMSVSTSRLRRRRAHSRPSAWRERLHALVR